MSVERNSERPTDLEERRLTLDEARFRLEKRKFIADAAKRKLDEKQTVAVIAKLKSENRELAVPWNKRPAYISAWFQGVGAVLTLAGTIAAATSIVAIIDLKHERFLADQSATESREEADALTAQIAGFAAESREAKAGSDAARQDELRAQAAEGASAFQLSQTLDNLRQKRGEEEKLEGTIATLKRDLDDALVADVREVVDHGRLSALPFRKDLTEPEKLFLHEAAFNEKKYDASERFELLLYLYGVDHSTVLYNDVLKMFSDEKSAYALEKMSIVLSRDLDPPTVAN